MTTFTTAASSSFKTVGTSASGSSISDPATYRRTYSTRPPRGPNATVKFWPFLAIIAVGTGAFAYISKSRAGQGMGHAPVARNEIPNK
ncbi:hypothetical protein F5B17DRAFT_392789 [Nemania serpens]|nr:hypothetical protein F5B17DRAFT_392789 [Nemania serpens]